MKNLQPIFKELAINKRTGLFITKENTWGKKCQFSSRVQRLLKTKLVDPDAFFVFDNKPLILFYDTPKDAKSIHKAIWNFNETPIVIFATNNSVEIFNGFNYLKDKSSLKLIGGKETLNDFNYFELVSGNTWEKYISSLTYKNRVDYNLLENIKAARTILINRDKLDQTIANALIGKVIFVRYLIDRKVKIGFKREKYWSNEEFCSVLTERKTAISFFKYLEEKFNGDMFLLSDAEYESISQNSLDTIINLLNEDDLGNGQKSLFKLYNFSIIPIEFISNIYESFIGQENQEKEGAYYTPLFLVDYILNETVEKYFNSNKKTYSCKVLDPACGSGIFLVESLRKIIERYIFLHPQIKENTKEFREVLRKLAIDNIFGIDKNLSAIQVAIFSIQLTLLDYQKPSSIETFQFPKLLHTNFFKSDFFDIEHEFNSKLHKMDFNFILGNPPWRRGKGEKSPLFVKYINDRKRFEKQKDFINGNQISISNNEIAQAFLLRVSDFKIKNNVALIATSKVLYNLNGQKFRKYFFDNYLIKKVFELAPVRYEIFNNSDDQPIAPAVVLFYKPSLGQVTDNNFFEHISLKPSKFFSLFKTFSLSRNDIKKVQQKKLKDYDWLLKTLVYGSYLDFNFINRLKCDFTNIGEETGDEKKYLKGQGVTINGKDDNDSSHLVGKSFLKTNKKNIQPFWLTQNITTNFEHDVIHRPRNENLFKAPMLLLKKGISNKFRMTSVVCNQDIVYTDSLTSIKIKKKDKSRLQVMSAILNSSFFSYLALNSFSSVGIEREQVHDEKWGIPFSFNLKICKKVKYLEKLLEKYYSEDNLCDFEYLGDLIKSEKDELDLMVINEFVLSDLENTLIDYANNVVIPIQMKLDGYQKNFDSINLHDQILYDYASLFINRFSKSLNTESHNFVIEILYSKHVIGMFFKVVPKETKQDSIIWLDKSKDGLLKMAIKLSSQKITDKLFVQKDLRGFDKDFFYLFKPNEKRLWHKAIGYQDVDEFMDAILKTGRRDYIEE